MSWACSSCPSRVKQEARSSNRFLSPNSAQVVAHIFAVSPFSTFDSRPSTAFGQVQARIQQWVSFQRGRSPAQRRPAAHRVARFLPSAVILEEPARQRGHHMYGLPINRQAAAGCGGRSPSKPLLGGTLSAPSICRLENRRYCENSCWVLQNSS
jgi:hypothetical protein